MGQKRWSPFTPTSITQTNTDILNTTRRSTQICCYPFFVTFRTTYSVMITRWTRWQSCRCYFVADMFVTGVLLCCPRLLCKKFYYKSSPSDHCVSSLSHVARVCVQSQGGDVATLSDEQLALVLQEEEQRQAQLAIVYRLQQRARSQHH